MNAPLDDAAHWVLRLRDFSTYETFIAPTWTQVDSVLRRMDGYRHDDAILEYVVDGTAAAWLILGGGEDGRVVVGLQQAGADNPHHLVDPTHEEALVVQTVGGQETPLPGRFYVSLELALRAAHHFYVHRCLDPDLHWQASFFGDTS